MPVWSMVCVPSRPVSQRLVTALQATNADCPEGEDWHVTVVEAARNPSVMVTVFRDSRSGNREVGQVSGWSLRMGDGSQGKVPLYSRDVTPRPEHSEDAWIGNVARAVGDLLRVLRP